MQVQILTIVDVWLKRTDCSQEKTHSNFVLGAGGNTLASTPKITVIIPVYSVEKYLNHCVSSVINQEYTNLEIILVDDGSPDSCPQLCDEWAAKDNRIVVIHKENGGLSDARNAGMDAATGDMMCFIDSDDWIETNTIMLAVNEMSKGNADVVVWGYSVDEMDSNENLLSRKNVYLDAFCKRGEGFETIIQAGGLALYAWNKLYRTHLLRNNGFRFEKGVSLVEDVLFNSLALPAADGVSFIEGIGTHYIQRKRITLGNAYYPNSFELLLRSAEANGTIFRAFGAPESVISNWQRNFRFSCLLQSCRNICHTDKLSLFGKSRELRQLLNSESTKTIVADYEPGVNRHNRIYQMLIRNKMGWMLLFLEKMRLSRVPGRKK